MKRLLNRMLDETAFLSDFGVRSMSKFYGEHPYVFERAGHRFSISYVPGDSATEVFGGNSNWRGPIWMPVNFLLIESLYRFHSYYGDDFKVECPVGSGTMLHLGEVAVELSRRLCRMFLRGRDGRRPVFGESPMEQGDPNFRDNLLFYEVFHGDTGPGLGAPRPAGSGRRVVRGRWATWRGLAGIGAVGRSPLRRHGWYPRGTSPAGTTADSAGDIAAVERCIFRTGIAAFVGGRYGAPRCLRLPRRRWQLSAVLGPRARLLWYPNLPDGSQSRRQHFRRRVAPGCGSVASVRRWQVWLALRST